MSRSLVVTALIAAVLGSATTAWLTTSRSAPEDGPLVLDRGSFAPQEPRARRSRGPRVDLRPRIQEEESRALPELHQRSEVEAYLERLIARARAQGRVSAVEVEPGMTAIFALRDELPEAEVLAMADDFDARMLALSAELGGADRPVAPRFDDALHDLRGADDPQLREDAIERALEALEPLDEPTRLEAEARLDEALADRREPIAEDFEALRLEIDHSPEGNARQDAVRRYVEAVENLPREQAEARLAEVERAEVPGASLL